MQQCVYFPGYRTWGTDFRCHRVTRNMFLASARALASFECKTQDCYRISASFMTYPGWLHCGCTVCDNRQCGPPTDAACTTEKLENTFWRPEYSDYHRISFNPLITGGPASCICFFEYEYACLMNKKFLILVPVLLALISLNSQCRRDCYRIRGIIFPYCWRHCRVNYWAIARGCYRIVGIVIGAVFSPVFLFSPEQLILRKLIQH